MAVGSIRIALIGTGNSTLACCANVSNRITQSRRSNNAGSQPVGHDLIRMWAETKSDIIFECATICNYVMNEWAAFMDVWAVANENCHFQVYSHVLHN